MNDMGGIDVSSWEEFEQRLPALQPSGSGRYFPLLFRGQSNSSWPINTTLERYGKKECSLKDYYRLVHRIRPQIETFANKKWEVPEFYDLMDWIKSLSRLNSGFPAGSYLMFLRHHGFPSPLLDWTVSPKIAAYFAFRSPIPPCSGEVSIYVFSEMPHGSKIMDNQEPQIFNFKSHDARHHRHFYQQSRYTVCMNCLNDEWRFAPYQNVISGDQSTRMQQDVLWKFNIPWSERQKVLKLLDEYNLNAHSLFGSEESLMETLAFREIDLQP